MDSKKTIANLAKAENFLAKAIMIIREEEQRATELRNWGTAETLCYYRKSLESLWSGDPSDKETTGFKGLVELLRSDI